MRDDDQDTVALHQLPGDTETEELYERLHSGNKEAIRQRAAEVLGNLADSAEEYDEEELVTELIKATLSEEKDSVKARVIDAIYLHGEHHLETLETALAKSIREGDSDQTVLSFFTDWLEAEQPEFRMVAASAVQRFGDKTVTTALEDRFDDPDIRVQSRAIEAYSRFGDSVSIEPIEPMLKNRSPRVRHAAGRALGNIGTEDALEALLPAARSRDKQLRKTAVTHLADLDRRKTATVLIKSLTDSSDQVCQEAMSSLIQLFSTGNAVTSGQIQTVIIDQSDPTVLPGVAKVLSEILAQSVDDRIRRYAVWLLGSIAETVQDDDVRELLIEWLDDADDIVADTAAASLRQQTGPELERQLQMLIRNTNLSASGKQRAQGILDQMHNKTRAEFADKDIKYTYLKTPADYVSQRTLEPS